MTTVSGDKGCPCQADTVGMREGAPVPWLRRGGDILGVCSGGAGGGMLKDVGTALCPLLHNLLWEGDCRRSAFGEKSPLIPKQ